MEYIPITYDYRKDVYTIIVNGKEITTQREELGWEDVVECAEKPHDIPYTITYRNAFPDKSGEMSIDDYITIQDGTIFNVVDTSKA